MSFLLIIYAVFATLCIGAGPLLKDLPVIGGSILACGAGERKAMRILAPLLILAGTALCCLVPTPAVNTALSIAAPSAAEQILAAGLATAITAAVTSGLSRFSALPLAFMGAVCGLGVAGGTGPGWATVSACVISWIVAPLLCAGLAALIYRGIAALSGKRKLHFAVHEERLMVWCAIAAVILAVSFGVNNAAMFAFAPIKSAGFGVAALAVGIGCALLSRLTFNVPYGNARWSIADNDLDVNTESTLAIILSMALVFAIFSTSLPQVAGLCATPLPAGVLFVSALTGISLTRGRALIEGEDIVKCFLVAVISPLLGAMLCYSLFRIMVGGAANTVVLLVLAAILAFIVMYMKRQEGQDIQRGIIRAREQQVAATQRSLAALEVRAEMTENDLAGKLEIKRKELVDFAVGISDQKKFMEDIYDELRKIRSMADGPEKDSATDHVLSSLRERMYFSREMNDFYARSEVLHKDFNMRLSERFPNLTEGERKLANLLRQGFSSKYIASLMNITPKSVEISRYRLRSKLGLSREDNLTQFIKTI